MTRERRSFGRIRKLPSGRYQAAYLGPDNRLYKAEATFAQKVDAEAWLTDRRREIDRELWSPPGEKPKKAKKAKATAFEVYAEQWVESRMVRGRPLKPRTKAHYKKLLAQHITPTFKGKPVDTLTREAVDRWYRRLDSDTPTIRAHSYSLLRAILATAVDDKLLDSNPCQVRGAGTAERRIRPKPLTVGQLATLTAAMPERLQAMVLLGSWTALRFGELVELRRKDIDLDNGVVMVRRAAVRVDGGWTIGQPKSDAGARDVAIPPNIIPALKDHLKRHTDSGKDALLFPAVNGGHLQPSTLYRHFYKARTAAKREDLRWHDLRHSGAVLAAQSGATLAELMARLGHSTPQAAMRYQHAAQGRDQQIAHRMAAIVAESAPPPESTKPTRPS